MYGGDVSHLGPLIPVAWVHGSFSGRVGRLSLVGMCLDLVSWAVKSENKLM